MSESALFDKKAESPVSEAISLRERERERRESKENPLLFFFF